MTLILKRASPSPRSGDDDYDVLANGAVVGRIFKVRLGGRTTWMWTLALGHHEDRIPTQGYEATREAGDGNSPLEVPAQPCGEAAGAIIEGGGYPR
jgi:hypothetical protein